MNIERFKATDSNQVRLSLDMTYNDLVQVRAFKPEALGVATEDDSTKFKFHIETGPETKLGKKGLRVKLPKNKEDMDKPVKFIVNLEGMEEPSLIGLLSNQKENIDIIEKQVEQAKEKLEAAKEQIKEV